MADSANLASQLEDYRREQRERFSQRPEAIEARQRQEREDEEIARRLQQELSAPELPRETFPTTPNRSLTDEEYAQMLQEQEDNRFPPAPQNFTYRPPPFGGHFESDVDEPRLPFEDPFEDVFSTFASLSPRHPFLHQVHSFPRRRGGARRIIFPPEYFQVEGTSNLPPNLLEMMRGEVPMSYESMLELGELLEPVNRGASKEEINTIPSRKFTKGTFPEEEAKCGICLADYEEEEEIKSLPQCLHHFHKACLDKWLGINKICPVCRTDIEQEGGGQ